MDLYEFVLTIYQEDRSGTVITPLPLLRYINQRVHTLTPQSILIPEAERHLAGLPWLISQCTGEVTLTTQYKPFYELFTLLFDQYQNVSIRFVSIYATLPDSSQYDYIFCLPAFGGKSMLDETAFLSRDLDGNCMVPASSPILRASMEYRAQVGTLRQASVICPITGRSTG